MDQDNVIAAWLHHSTSCRMQAPAILRGFFCSIYSWSGKSTYVLEIQLHQGTCTFFAANHVGRYILYHK